MAQQDFIDQLRALGLHPQELRQDMVGFDYTIPIGKNTGKNVKIAFQVPKDFPMNCPPGPHIDSLDCLGWVESPRNVHKSPLGPSWRYWSRPFPNWNKTCRTVRVYLSHVRNILNSI